MKHYKRYTSPTVHPSSDSNPSHPADPVPSTDHRMPRRDISTSTLSGLRKVDFFPSVAKDHLVPAFPHVLSNSRERHMKRQNDVVAENFIVVVEGMGMRMRKHSRSRGSRVALVFLSRSDLNLIEFLSNMRNDFLDPQVPISCQLALRPTCR